MDDNIWFIWVEVKTVKKPMWLQLGKGTRKTDKCFKDSLKVCANLRIHGEFFKAQDKSLI